MANRVLIGLPGQTFDGTSKSYFGTPLVQHQDQPFVISLSALTPGGNLDAGFTLNSAGLNLRDGIGGALQIVTQPNWINGQATAQVRIGMAHNNAILMTGDAPSPYLPSSSQGVPVLPKAGAVRVYGEVLTSQNACQPLLVTTSAGAADATTARIGSPVGFTMTISGSANVYSTSDCVTGLGSSLGFNVGDSAKLVYVKFSSGTSQSLFFNSSGSLAGGGFNIPSVVTGTLIEPDTLKISGAAAFRPHACQAFMVGTYQGVDSVPPGGPLTVQLTHSLASAMDGSFFTSSDCSGGWSPSLSVTIDPNGVLKRAALFYFRSKASGAFQLTATDVSSTPSCAGAAQCSQSVGTFSTGVGP